MFLFTRANRVGILRMQTDAAVRRRAAEVRDFVAAVDGVPAAEEDRVRHRRPVVLAGEPFACPKRTSSDQTLPLLRNLLCLGSVVPRPSSGMVACTGEIS